MAQKKRYRISTNFLSIKIFVVICFVFLCLNLLLVDNQQNSFLPFIALTILLGGVFYFTTTREVIEFDNIDNLYVVDKKNKEEFKIPLQNIDKILFSAIGLNLFQSWNYSYRIIYRDNNSHTKKIRLFPRTGQNDISKIINLTKIKNPKVKVCNWSFGWNEFAD